MKKIINMFLALSVCVLSASFTVLNAQENNWTIKEFRKKVIMGTIKVNPLELRSFLILKSIYAPLSVQVIDATYVKPIYIKIINNNIIVTFEKDKELKDYKTLDLHHNDGYSLITFEDKNKKSKWIRGSGLVSYFLANNNLYIFARVISGTSYQSYAQIKPEYFKDYNKITKISESYTKIVTELIYRKVEAKKKKKETKKDYAKEMLELFRKYKESGEKIRDFAKQALGVDLPEEKSKKTFLI